MKIIVVEDDENIREVLKEYLRRMGHEVFSLRTGREALDVIRRQDGPFDVACVDWQLPGISGREVVHALLHQSSSTAIFITTGLQPSNQEVLRAALQNKVQVVQKPYSLHALYQQILSVMR